MGDIFSNKIILITLFVWVITQTLKVIIGVFVEKRFNFRWFVGTGGMPSSHAAGATALATICGLDLGFDSVIFGFSAIFAIVTMFDAQGVRRSAGQQAAILNKIMDDIYWEGKMNTDKLLEFIGHTPLQVIIGGFLGIVLAGILNRFWGI